jgi:hypothetical protein
MIIGLLLGVVVVCELHNTKNKLIDRYLDKRGYK